MRARPIGQRVRARLAAVAATTAVLIAAAACTTATAGPSSRSPSHSQSPASLSQGQSHSQGQGTALVVTTVGGAVRGKDRRGDRRIPGIPYAAPPVGALRWQPPRLAVPWHGVRRPSATPSTCPQPSSPFGAAGALRGLPVPERVRPAGARASNLPVMVGVHGGSLRTGESDDYNPAGLVRDGVVVVTINYRLGALGFLADAALASRPDVPSGNYGLIDQQAALRWVQRNIRGFGGDPGHVTCSANRRAGRPRCPSGLSRRGRAVPARDRGERDLPADPATRSPRPKRPGGPSRPRPGAPPTPPTPPTPANTAACLRRLPVVHHPGRSEPSRLHPRHRRLRAHPVDQDRAGQRAVQPRAGDDRHQP